MTYRDFVANSRELPIHPPLAALGEDGLEVAFKEGAGILEVLCGVGFGGGDALKHFVEEADDPLLHGERGKLDWNGLEQTSLDSLDRCSSALVENPLLVNGGVEIGAELFGSGPELFVELAEEVLGVGVGHGRRKKCRVISDQ